MAEVGSGHALTINSYPTSAACFADLRDHAVRLMKRRNWHGRRRCCDGQHKRNSDQPDHWFLHFLSPGLVKPAMAVVVEFLQMAPAKKQCCSNVPAVLTDAAVKARVI